MKIVKPNAEIKYAIIHGKQTTCYKESDCVEVDIDNLEIEYRFRYCKPTMIDGTLCFTYHRKFSEFLQERMK